MPRKIKTVPVAAPMYETYQYENRVYQIDAQHKKVYRRFVEIETAKAFEILSSWRERPVTA